MFAVLVTALLLTGVGVSSPESGFAGELVATWVHEDASTRTAIHIDADGLCAVTARNKKTGAGHRTLCAYWVVGHKVYLRAKADSGPRPVMEADYDRDADALAVAGGHPMIFERRAISERAE